MSFPGFHIDPSRAKKGCSEYEMRQALPPLHAVMLDVRSWFAGGQTIQYRAAARRRPRLGGAVLLRQRFAPNTAFGRLG